MNSKLFPLFTESICGPKLPQNLTWDGYVVWWFTRKGKRPYNKNFFCKLYPKVRIAERINFKLLITTFKSLNGLAPPYLKELLITYTPKRTLRSAKKGLLIQPICRLKSYGQRAFSYAAPKLWNSLPFNLRTCANLSHFKSQVKTLLFKRAFNL